MSSPYPHALWTTLEAAAQSDPDLAAIVALANERGRETALVAGLFHLVRELDRARQYAPTETLAITLNGDPIGTLPADAPIPWIRKIDR